MPYFSKKSDEKLETCDERLIVLFNEVIRHFDCTIIEGYRSQERQHQLFLDGKTKVRTGKHNLSPSLAVDVAPYPINWSDIARFRYFGGFVLGIATTLDVQIRWGGDWSQDHILDDQTFNDFVHFEIADI